MVPPPAPGDPQNIVDRQTKQLLENSTNLRKNEEAQLDQQVELSRPRPIVDHRATLNHNQDRVSAVQAEVIPVFYYFQLYDDEKDVGYVELTEIRAIILPVRPHYVKFDLTSAMIKFLNLKGVILGLAIDDTNMYLTNFLGICTTYTILGVDQKALIWKFFPF